MIFHCEKKKSNRAEPYSFGAIRFDFGAIRFRFGAIRFRFCAIIYTLARFLLKQGKNNFCGDEIINI